MEQQTAAKVEMEIEEAEEVYGGRSAQKRLVAVHADGTREVVSWLEPVDDD